jgi:hypothetical protein
MEPSILYNTFVAYLSTMFCLHQRSRILYVVIYVPISHASKIRVRQRRVRHCSFIEPWPN